MIIIENNMFSKLFLNYKHASVLNGHAGKGLLRALHKICTGHYDKVNISVECRNLINANEH